MSWDISQEERSVPRTITLAALHESAIDAVDGALLETNGSGWLHAWAPRAPHGDDALAVLRSRTGDAAFDDAWARGRSIAATGAGEIALDGS